MYRKHDVQASETPSHLAATDKWASASEMGVATGSNPTPKVSQSTTTMEKRRFVPAVRLVSSEASCLETQMLLPHSGTRLQAVPPTLQGAGGVNPPIAPGWFR